jgi:hypothetical protein
VGSSNGSTELPINQHPKMSATTAPESTKSNPIESAAFDLTFARESQLKEVYGGAQFDQVLKFDEELLRAEWEACQLFFLGLLTT